MKVAILIIGCYFSIFYGTSAQILSGGFGAETNGNGGANIAANRTEALFNNVAGIVFAKQVQGITSIKSQYNGFFVSMGFGAIVPLKHGTAALSIMNFGDKVYSEQRLSTAYAFKKEGVQLGVRGNLFQVNAQGFGSRFSPSLDLGVITQLDQRLWLGAYISNVTQAGFTSTDLNEKVTSEIAIGISYQPIQKFSLQADISKEVEQQVSFRTGIEYLLANNLFVRTGINSATKTMHWGASVLLKKIIFHYSINHHSNLGNTHQLSIAILFKSLSEKVNGTNDTE